MILKILFEGKQKNPGKLQILILPLQTFTFHLIYSVIISFQKLLPPYFFSLHLPVSNSETSLLFFFSKRIQFGGSKSAFLLQRGIAELRTHKSTVEQPAKRSKQQFSAVQCTVQKSAQQCAKRSFFQDFVQWIGRDNSVIRIMCK